MEINWIILYTVDDFREKTGIERVVEALQCAEWPNMKLKGTLKLTLKEMMSDLINMYLFPVILNKHFLPMF